MNNNASSKLFAHHRRIYYADTDAASVVYYATHLTLFEETRTEWLRSLGFNQSTLKDKHQILFLVKSVRELNYLTQLSEFV